MSYTAKQYVDIAAAEVGYIEKASNKNLDDKTANAGAGNWTKYARDLRAAGYYNGNKNGFAWCDVFVDWCHYMAAGKDAVEAQRVECQTGKLGACCTYSMNYYKNKNRFSKTPQIGDQIFFKSSGSTGSSHTGLVEKFDATYVYTIEGNANNRVKRNKYKLNSSSIIGYGHPLFEDSVEEIEFKVNGLTKGDSGDEVKNLQANLIKLGYSCGSKQADGIFGDETEKAVMSYQKDRVMEVTGIADVMTLKLIVADLVKLQEQGASPSVENGNIISTSTTIKRGDSGSLVRELQTKLVLLESTYGNYGVDGKFGPKTEASLKLFQKSHGLAETGICDDNTWKVLSDCYNDVLSGYDGVVTASKLNVRKTPGMKLVPFKVILRGTKVTIIKQSGKWGLLSDYSGWVYLPYIKKV